MWVIHVKGSVFIPKILFLVAQNVLKCTSQRLLN